LNRIPGVSCQLPAGAFYAFPNISATGLKSDVLANLLLNDAGVAVLPGTAFGKLGEGFLRVSYANSSEKLREALKRMQHLFENL
jgi:aspartate/methionine/tyrosine aminotransferase